MISPDQILNTPRLTLRLLGVDDAESYTDLNNDETLARNASRITFPFTLATATQSLINKIEAWSAGEEYSFGAFVGGQLIGHAGLRLAPEGWTLGYGVHRDYRGQGYATELAGALCRFGFEKLNFTEIHAGHYLDNPASGAVLKKLGFVLTGEQSLIFSKGRGEKVAGVEYVLKPENFILPAIHQDTDRLA